KFIKGFITDIGGRTSHSAILARTLEIPAVVGAKSAMSTIDNGTIVIIDGLEGDFLLEPDEATLAEYKEKQSAFASQKAEWAKLKNEATVTKDG
ncbi:PEP-utilizing enzyme, partial [Bacillus sp. SIMBA_161]